MTTPDETLHDFAAGAYPPTDAQARALAAEVLRLRVERDALRAIIAGRATPPTEAECAALAAARGEWLVWWQWSSTGGQHSEVMPAKYGYLLADQRTRFGADRARWIALDSAHRPCAWPEVAP